MPIVLAGTPGKVFEVRNGLPGEIEPLVSVSPDGGGPSVDFESLRCIVIGAGLAQGTNHQFAHMLGGDLYVYAFGDRMTDIQIRGLAFSRSCDNENGVGGDGLDHLLNWYRRFKLSQGQAQVLVSISKQVFRSLLYRVAVDQSSEQNHITQFTLFLGAIDDGEQGPETTP